MSSKISPVWLLVVVASLACFTEIRSEAQAVELGRVTGVALYQDSALVSHEQRVPLREGINKLTLNGLPTNAVSQSVQVEFPEMAGLQVREITFTLSEESEQAEPVKILEEKLKEVRKEIAKLEAAQLVFDKKKTYAHELANSFAKGFGASGEERPDIDEARAVWAYAESAHNEAQDGLAALKQQVADKEKSVKELEKELAEARKQQGSLRGKVSLSLTAVKGGEALMRLSYLAPDCGWIPAYEIRAEPSNKRLSLGYRAMAFQNTQLEWNGVKAVLHTGNANRSGNAPQLDGLYLTPLSEREMMFSKSSVVLYESPPVDKSTRVQQDTTSFQAVLSEAVTLKGDGTQVRLAVLEKELAATFWTEITPSVLQEGYLLGESANTLEMPILAGPAMVFTDGKLTTQVDIARVPPGEKFTVSMGVDERISVKRREGRQMEQQTGLIDKTVTLKREFHTDVTNTRTTPHEVRVKDRFPVSRNAKIEVRTESPKSKEVELDADTGVFEWRQTLNGGTTRTFSTRYSVVYPRDWIINTDF